MTKLNNRLQEILQIEGFRQNDIVEYISIYNRNTKEKAKILQVWKQLLLVAPLKTGSLWYIELPIENAKLINRNFTLSDVLVAMRKVTDYPYHCVYYIQSNTIVREISKPYCDNNALDWKEMRKKTEWSLQKDGIDLGVNEQSEKCKSLLEEVLK